MKTIIPIIIVVAAIAGITVYSQNNKKAVDDGEVIVKNDDAMMENEDNVMEKNDDLMEKNRRAYGERRCYDGR